jgi:DNA repair exonuclease SbcCD ATPase subunit
VLELKTERSTLLLRKLFGKIVAGGKERRIPELMARILEEANKRLGAEKPELEKEIARIDGQKAKAQGTIDRYLEAFEAGTLKAELCNEKVRDLRTRMEELEGEKRSLEARRERLELPAIDKEMLASLLDNFEQVMAEGPNPKKKHLLHQLVKKVLIQSRQTNEIWYALPNSQRFANCNIWLPGCASMRNHPGRVEPEI